MIDYKKLAELNIISPEDIPWFRNELGMQSVVKKAGEFIND